MKKNLLLLVVVCISLNTWGQTKSMQPFTGAMIIENGIRYDDLEIKVNDNLLLIPDIPQNEEIVIRITKPWSFIPDAAGNIHPGVGFRIADKTGKIIAVAENIYEDDKEGFEPSYLKALSLTLTLDERMPLNDSITLYTKFFDLANNDSLLVILPCRIVAKGAAQTLNNWNSFSSTYGTTGLFVQCKVDDFDMKKTYTKEPTASSADTINLSIKTLGDFVLKNNKAFLKANFILYDNNFNVIETKDLFPDAAEGLSMNELENIKQIFILPNGFTRGIARIQCQDLNGPGKLDAILNFVY